MPIAFGCLTMGYLFNTVLEEPWLSMKEMPYFLSEALKMAYRQKVICRFS